jgi:hypothetical protein
MTIGDGLIQAFTTRDDALRRSSVDLPLVIAA